MIGTHLCNYASFVRMFIRYVVLDLCYSAGENSEVFRSEGPGRTVRFSFQGSVVDELSLANSHDF